ncbi:MAG: malto-oligosyltrehalose synthase, partial [Acidobacteria bacterium]|nr:malto-oligosyltrehalose synthase [Acidobacteriota bacterium]
NAVLESSEFRGNFLPFLHIVAHFGILNSLSQTVIKLTAPGVPDIYQGNELLEFNLVDPDNRRPVDYKRRQQLLSQFQAYQPAMDGWAEHVRELAEHKEDSRIKLYVIWKLLSLRREQPDLLRDGDYIPLTVVGAHAKHLIAFARILENDFAIVAVPRFCARLLKGEPRLPSTEDIWQDTSIELRQVGAMGFRNVFTGRPVELESFGDRHMLPVGHLFTDLPVAVVTSTAG